MEQIKRLLASLTLKQKISIAVAAAAVVAALYGGARWNKERDFKPLYSGLSAEDAGAVLAKLRETGVEYRVEEGGSAILAPSARVAELRLQMAAAGLPKTGRIGYELFDKTNFGQTEFAEQVNYHRALEGELERSVMALSEVEQARVHVTLAKDSLFIENSQPAKASVMIKLRPGARIAEQNVLAITHLVSSAVEKLAPEAVSVLDMNGKLLNRPRRASSPETGEASEAAIEYRRSIERDLLAKIDGTLEPLLGAGKFRAGVFVECDFTSGEQTEESLDPAKSVMVTSQRTEEYANGGSASGVPGTPSALPRPVQRAAGSSSSPARQTENITYQTSRTVRLTRIPQGAVKKISASLLIDHAVRWEGTGAKARRVLEAPSPEKLKVIRDLVAGAIGFSAERGDQLVVETLPFDSTTSAGPPPSTTTDTPSGQPRVESISELMHKHKFVLIGVAAGVLLTLAAIGFAVVKRSKRKMSVSNRPAVAPGEGAPAALSAPGEFEKQMQAKLAEQAALKEKLASEALNSLRLQPVITKKTEVLTKHIVEEATKDPTSMAYIVRTWLNDSES
jgi:flagellar M-ring protein FliF